MNYRGKLGFLILISFLIGASHSLLMAEEPADNVSQAALNDFDELLLRGVGLVAGRIGGDWRGDDEKTSDALREKAVQLIREMGIAPSERLVDLYVRSLILQAQASTAKNVESAEMMPVSGINSRGLAVSQNIRVAAADEINRIRENQPRIFIEKPSVPRTRGKQGRRGILVERPEEKEGEMIVGRAMDTSGIASVYINNQEAHLQHFENGARFSQWVPLMGDLTPVTVEAYGRDGQPGVFEFDLAKKDIDSIPTVDGRLLVIAVGIDDYLHLPPPTPNEPSDLEYAEKDASDLLAQLQRYRGYFTEVIVEPIIGSAAKKERILEALLKIFNEAGPKDVVLVYFAGHGFSEDGEAYFLPYEGRGFTSAEGFSFSEVGRHIYADVPLSAAILIVDACQSAGAAHLPKVLESYSRTRAFEKNSNRIIWTASMADEFSHEMPGFPNGIFTYNLLQGLNGGADVQNDGFISTGEIRNYVNSKVSELTAGKQNPYMYAGAGMQAKLFPVLAGQSGAVAVAKTSNLELRVSPPDALVSVNGSTSNAVRGTFVKSEMARGTYRVKVWADGYASWESDIRLPLDKPMAISLEKLDARKTGNLVVWSEASSIYIDGNLIGRDNVEVKLEPGTYRVEARRPGYKSDSKSVKVLAGKTANYEFRLKPEGRILPP